MVNWLSTLKDLRWKDPAGCGDEGPQALDWQFFCFLFWEKAEIQNFMWNHLIYICSTQNTKTQNIMQAG